MQISKYQQQDQNLIPFYIIDDRLKKNVQKNNQFMTDCIQQQFTLKTHIDQIQIAQQTLKRQTNQKLQEIQKKIYRDISAQLEGRIAIILGQRMAGIIQAAEKRQAAMNNLQANIDKKIQSSTKSLKYQISQDNQKFFLKQIKKLKQSGIGSGKGSSIGSANMENSEYEIMKKQQKLKQLSQKGSQNDWYQGHRALKQLENRIDKIQDFNIGFDKRFYQSMSALRQNWKQIGGQLLENKKSVNKKVEDLKVELIKLKNLKDFANTPEKIDQSFRSKITQKFTDIYRMLADSVNKHQYENNLDALKKKVDRHNGELFDVREQLAKNTQFFTFYMNNADNDDLKGQLAQMENLFTKNKQTIDLQIQSLKDQYQKQQTKIQKLRKLLQDMKDIQIAMDARVTNVNTAIDQMLVRLDKLEDYNKFGPQKLNKITQVLDNDMTLQERQLIQKKNANGVIIQPQNTNQALARQLRGQITKMKDQIFVLNTLLKQKDQQFTFSKKQINSLEFKIDKVRLQAQQAVVARKPWNCLSCQKIQKETKKQTKLKKAEPIRAGGYGGLQAAFGKSNQKHGASSKSINTPPYEDKFEVYQKFRQKYLSDTVKLPDIYKQKIGDKDPTKMHE